MKSIQTISYILIILIFSCKQNEIKNIIWSDGQTHFQITDSLVYFNLGPNRDYSYIIQNDSLFLYNQFCDYDKFSFKFKIIDGKLNLIERDTLGDMYLRKYQLEKNINQNFLVSPKLSIQKIYKNSNNCIIEGNWFDSVNNKYLMFKKDSVYVIEMAQKLSTFPSVFKGKYKCFNEISFLIHSNCNNELFDIEFRDDSIIKLKSTFYNELIFKRLSDISIDDNTSLEGILLITSNKTNFDSIYYYNDSTNKFNLNQLFNI